MWRPADEPWQYRVLDAMKPGVDVAQLEQALRMSVTERIESMVEVMRVAEQLRAGQRRR